MTFWRVIVIDTILILRVRKDVIIVNNWCGVICIRSSDCIYVGLGNTGLTKISLNVKVCDAAPCPLFGTLLNLCVVD